MQGEFHIRPCRCDEVDGQIDGLFRPVDFSRLLLHNGYEIRIYAIIEYVATQQLRCSTEQSPLMVCVE